jgi:hypothetical protein
MVAFLARLPQLQRYADLMQHVCALATSLTLSLLLAPDSRRKLRSA